MSWLPDALHRLDNPRILRYARNTFIVLTALTVVSNGIAIRVALRADSQQREGRDIARDFSCATTSAVIDAGIATIKGGGQLPPRLQRELQRFGYPSRGERDTANALAAAAYARRVATKVQEFTGRSDLVRPDGSLDCARLRAVTKP